MPNEKLIRGTEVKLAHQTFMVPPLTLEAVKAMRADIMVLNGEFGDEQIDAINRIGLAAIRRNYPEVTAEYLREVLDMENMAHLLAAAIRSHIPDIPTRGEEPAPRAGE